MTIRFLFVLLSLPIAAFGQFGGVLGMEQGYFRAPASEPTLLEQRPGFGFRVGVDYFVATTPRLLFRTGLRYAEGGTRIDDALRFPSDLILVQSGGVSPGSHLTRQHRYQFLEIPLALRYRLFDGTPHLYLDVGLQPNLYLRSSERTTLIETGRITIQEFSRGRSNLINPVQLATTFGLGLDLNLSKQWVLYVQPRFRYFLSPYWRSNSDRRIYTLGIDFGVRKTWNDRRRGIQSGSGE